MFFCPFTYIQYKTDISHLQLRLHRLYFYRLVVNQTVQCPRIDLSSCISTIYTYPSNQGEEESNSHVASPTLRPN